MVCCHRYKKVDERQLLDGLMSRLLPLLCHIGVQLFSDQSELSVLVQKHILKVFFSFIQVQIAENFFWLLFTVSVFLCVKIFCLLYGCTWLLKCRYFMLV